MLNTITRSIINKLFTLALIAASFGGAAAAPTTIQWFSAPPPDYYGAVAYSPSTGRFGSSWNFTSPDNAEKRAMQMCGRSDCRVLLELNDSCGALAVSRTGGYVWGEGSSLYEAKLLTSNRCTAQYGGCKLICSICSAGDNP
jgi:hypothetical protein